MADNNPETTVYVANAGSKDIFVLAMDRTSGELTLIEKTPVPGTGEPSPNSLPMALAPNKRFLYAQLRSPPYPISSFSIDPATGRLTHLTVTPLIDQMAYLNVDRSGKFLLGASYVGSKIAIYPINPHSVVEPEATQIIDTKPKPHCVVVDAPNKHVYVPVLGADIIMQFSFDAGKGTLMPNDPASIATKPGAGPRHLTLHPNGRFAYLLTETRATIGTYAIDQDKGTLSELQFVNSGDYKEQPWPSDIHVTPNGKFLYGAERKSSTLISFKIDPANGTLTKIGAWPTEKTPRGFNIDPRGKFLLAVGMDSGGLTVHAIDEASGELNPVGHYKMGSEPNWIEIVDLKA